MSAARRNNIMHALMLVLVVGSTPAHFQQFQQTRDLRSVGYSPQRTAQRMMGGYMRINTIGTADKSEHELITAGAGEGKLKRDEKDEDTKTLSDQVKEGKYALIQNEIFTNQPKRPGVIGYESNPETAAKDNNNTFGGLKNNDIWLADGHLLVLKGGKYPPPGVKEPDPRWPAIDDYEAPRRQVKLPKKPKVPPPFPVQLKDGGPIVYITSEGGRIPAPPPLGGLSAPYAPYPPYPFDPFQGDFTPGGAPYPFPPFPFPDFSKNQSEGGQGYFPPPLPFAPPINASFAGFPPYGPPQPPLTTLPPFPQLPQLPPLPPPGNLTEFDEDDPSNFYPPPYSFSYKKANLTVEAGPLVPGIVLPPPPDFFELEDNTTRPQMRNMSSKITSTTSTTTSKPTTTTTHIAPIKNIFGTTIQNAPVKQIVPTLPPQPITVYFKQRPKPIDLSGGFIPISVNTLPLTDSPDNSIDIITTTPRPFTVPVKPLLNYRRPEYAAHPESIVIIPKPIKQKPVDFSIVKSKPALSFVYDIPDNYYNTNSVSQSHKPFQTYGLPRGQVKQTSFGNSFVTTTQVPLRAYYESSADRRPQQHQYFRQNAQYFRPAKPNSSPLTSYYFYDEVSKTTTQTPYYSNRQKGIQNIFYETNSQGYSPIDNIEFKPLNNQQGTSLFSLPSRQGSRTLTQEYFSIQKPKGQNNNYVSQLSTPDSFFKQIADIKQTIDLYTTAKPNSYYQPNYSVYKQPTKLRTAAKPVYQYSFQSQGLPQKNSFRAPILDSEPFRPMVAYSEPYDVKYQTTPKTTTFQQYLIETQTITTERPLSNKYVSTGRTHDYEYNEVSGGDSQQNAIKTNLENTFIYSTEVSSPKTPVKSSGGLELLDEFEEITKKYFTVFGQKLDGVSTTPTTVLESAVDNAINAVVDKNEKITQSLAGDTLVNYRNPLPPINPDSEFIPITDPSYQAQLEAERRFNLLRQQVERERQHAARISAKAERQGAQQEALVIKLADGFKGDRRGELSGDTAVNYRNPLPEVNIESESVAATGDNAAGEGRPGSFVSYRLPGQGAHVYFLTPRAVAPATQGIR